MDFFLFFSFLEGEFQGIELKEKENEKKKLKKTKIKDTIKELKTQKIKEKNERKELT